MNSKPSLYAIIPARGGSKGVPQKNTRCLGNFPLIAYSIAAARMSKWVVRVIVSTDCPDIARQAKQFGAEVPFLRPSEISQDRSTDQEFLLHAIDWFQSKENHVPDYWAHLRPTTPLRDPKVLDQAIERFLQRPDSTSLRSAHLAPETPFKWFSKNPAGYFAPLTPGLCLNDLNRPRQDFPDAFIPDGYVDVLSTQQIKTGSIHGERILAFESPVCCEVDTLEDLEYLEFELRRKPFALEHFLQEQS